MYSNVLKSLQEVSFPCILGDIFRLFLNWRILVKMWRTFIYRILWFSNYESGNKILMLILLSQYPRLFFLSFLSLNFNIILQYAL